MKTKTTINIKRAFTVLELMVVVFIIMVAAGLLLPALSRPRHQGYIRMQCVNNLKQNGIAFRIWADDNGSVYPMQYRTNDFDGPSFANEKQMFVYFQSISNEISNPKMVVCPNDEKRMAATNFTTDFNSSRVSYFVGLDANETNPACLLAGDRNLTNGFAAKNGILEVTTNQAVGWAKKIHMGQGNVLFTDAHVEMLSASRLKDAVARTGMATNRLVFPQ